LVLKLVPEHCVRIYVVHDEVKDKQFELELSWVGESKCISHTACIISHDLSIPIVTDGKHKVVPQEIFQEAEQYAKVNVNYCRECM